MDKKNKISVAIATYNEEANLADCLKSVAGWVDEIIIVDGGSTDKTVEVGRKNGAQVIETTNLQNFHINKVKAIAACSGDWILQLDADERVSRKLAEEIRAVIQMKSIEIEKRVIEPTKLRLFRRHQELIKTRDGIQEAADMEIVAFFLPRVNYFLGGPIRFAGTYPDGVIRLFKRGQAQLPALDVHEQMKIRGKVAWLTEDLIHLSNPTISKYLKGADIYTSLQAKTMVWGRGWGSDLRETVSNMVIKPWTTFVSLYILHKGILDGWRGLVFCIFSSLHYPVAYIKQIIMKL